jgi:hypothetical protein
LLLAIALAATSSTALTVGILALLVFFPILLPALLLASYNQALTLAAALAVIAMIIYLPLALALVT